MRNKKNDVVHDIYREIIIKRNKCKIDLDNYAAEIEIAKKSIEYSSSIEDDSVFFSPRRNEKSIDNENDLNSVLEKYENLLEIKNKEFEYYDEYCKRLADYLKLNDNEESVLKNIKDNEKKYTYNINLNYDVNDIKNKLLMLKNMTEICIRIFDNDRERTRQELIRIDKSIEDIIKEL